MNDPFSYSLLITGISFPIQDHPRRIVVIWKMTHGHGTRQV
uniref:Uncharacterized protein n=1 Tax=Arundo donax TaxID=35708 RepID=A0A0A8YXW2_ARUDO